MFVTPTGPVLGTAEMLKPVSWNQQPFRFVGLEQDDQRRLQDSIQSSFGQVSKDQEWIDKTEPHWTNSPPAPAAFQLAPGGPYPGTSVVGSAIYLFSIVQQLDISPSAT